MSLDADAVKKIAHLARLALNGAQVGSLQKDLDNILNLVDEMNSVDTQAITPMAHPLDETQPLRADAVTETNQRDNLLKNAPEAQDGFFLVPQFIETDA